MQAVFDPPKPTDVLLVELGSFNPAADVVSRCLFYLSRGLEVNEISTPVKILVFKD